MPVVSIVIPVNNRANLLAQTLDSVLSQTFTDWECIIVDDHSTDDSFLVAEEYAKKDSRFFAFKLPDTKRYGNAARNYGLSFARGDFVNFLDSDDLLSPQKLQIQLDLFEKEPGLDMVACRHDLWWEKDDGFQIFSCKFADRKFWLDVVWHPDYLKRYGGLWCTNAPLWRKVVVTEIGAWDEDLRAWQDVALNIHALIYGVKIDRIEQTLVHVRKTGTDNITSPSAVKSESILKGLKKTWSLLAKRGMDTKFRREMVSLNILSQSQWLLSKKLLFSSFRYWTTGCTITKQPIIRILMGYFILISLSIPIFKPFYYHLRSKFYKHLKSLPDAV